MKLTFQQIKKWAINNNWYIEKNGRKYNYWKVNSKGTPTDGIECESTSLEDAYSEMWHCQRRVPITLLLSSIQSKALKADAYVCCTQRTVINGVDLSPAYEQIFEQVK